MTQVTELDALGFGWLQAMDGASLFGLWLRLGWGLVLGALTGQLVSAVHQSGAESSAARAGAGWPWATAVVATLVTWLAPGPWSAAHWLGLAFFAPSGLLVGLSAVTVWRLSGRSARLPTRAAAWMPMPPLLAMAIAGSGALLYAAHLTALPLDLYAMGHGRWAPLWVMLPASLIALGLWWQGHGTAAWAVATALLLHSLLRLPTPNAWDAVLDPWLWLWAVAACTRLGVRHVATMRAQA
jgi:hypothetical protein